MGVLACNRVGCENIMCDNVSHEYGYLCGSCKQELIARGECRIEDFMYSEKKSVGESSDWEDHVNEVFRNRFEEEKEYE